MPGCRSPPTPSPTKDCWMCSKLIAKVMAKLNLLSAATNEVRLRDLTAGEVLTVDAKGRIITKAELGKPAGFVTMPVAVDLDGEGRNEIVLQNAAGEIIALKSPTRPGDSPKILWSVPGVAMNVAPGYG